MHVRVHGGVRVHVRAHTHTHTQFGSFFLCRDNSPEVLRPRLLLILGDLWLDAEQCIICFMVKGEHIQGNNGEVCYQS